MHSPARKWYGPPHRRAEHFHLHTTWHTSRNISRVHPAQHDEGKMLSPYRQHQWKMLRSYNGRRGMITPMTADNYTVARAVFLRALALIYCIAFLSLGMQIAGLAGKHGILPASTFLELVAQRFQWQRYWLVPSLCWLDSSDLFLQSLCAAGAVLSLLLFAGRFQSVILFLLWVFYLSLCAVCRDFLAFQWDVLLLETGFLAILLVSQQRIALLLMHWLLFRLMFSSGIVKLLSGDPTWRDFTALNFHYETQPLPTWIGWYAHQLPSWFQKLSVAVMFGAELVVPFLIFLPRRFRLTACFTLIGFQILIFVTGNYCFFNLLAISLCLLLIEDALWPEWIRKWFQPSAKPYPWSTWPVRVAASILFLLSLMELSGTLHLATYWPQSVVQMYRIVSPFRAVNGYGLFAVMTTTRMEIVIEGSTDGKEWKNYEFKYKPGNLQRRPSFVEPHQPRLDWQMWFAALEDYQSNDWFVPFCYRLLDGSPEVLALLEYNPFPVAPPKFIRAVWYQYHFNTIAGKRSTGAWWTRESKGTYSPVFAVSLSESGAGR